MKLSDFVGGFSTELQKRVELDGLINFFDFLSKSTGDTGRAPTIGIDNLVNSWVRQQFAYREQLLEDLFTISRTVSEIAAPILHIRNEVFRRGITWEPQFARKCSSCGAEYKNIASKCEKCGSEKLVNPDESQLDILETFLPDCNVFDQSLEDVLKQFHEQVNSLDDGFLYISKEYFRDDKGGRIRSKPIEIRSLRASAVEFDLDDKGLPKNNLWICVFHREEAPLKEAGDCPKCKAEDYRVPLKPTMYKYKYRGKIIPLLDSEICHVSKFYPSELYGYSPILILFEKALTLLGMDKCYDNQTDVLTRNGWKKFEDVLDEDEFATIDQDHNLVYQKSKNGLYRYWHDGPMYGVKTDAIDLLVSPHHRMYVSQNYGKTFGIEEAQNIFGQSRSYLRAGAKWQGVYRSTFTIPGCKRWKQGGVPKDIVISLGNWAKFLGMWYSRGWANKEKGIVFYGKDADSLYLSLEKLMPLGWSQTDKYIQSGSRTLAKILYPYTKNKRLLLEEIIRLLPLGAQCDFLEYAKRYSFIPIQQYRAKHVELVKDLEKFGHGLEYQSYDTKKEIILHVDREQVEYPEVILDMNLWLEFLGYYLSEGNTIPNSTRIQIAQENGWKKERIEACLGKMPMAWKRGEKAFRCGHAQLSEYLKQFGHAKDKYIPIELLSLPVEQLRILFDALLLGDGGVTSSEKLRDQMMEIAIKLGYGATYSIKKYPDKEWHDTYYMHFAKKKKLSYVNVHKKNDRWENYTGWAYCVEVPNTLLCVRRNGKTVWSGNTLFRYFFERKMPASMLMVATDDPVGIKRMKETIIAQMRQNPDHVPIVGYSQKQGRGRVDLVRLFHTLQEMDYLPVRNEIRERVAAIWGLPPMWQSEYTGIGGLSGQTQQMVQFSRVVESDQRMFNEKIFPFILEAFGITDWILRLEQPEERSEATRIAFAQQRVTVASTLRSMGFDIELREGVKSLDDVDFKVSGKPSTQKGDSGHLPGVGSEFLSDEFSKQSQGSWTDQLLAKGHIVDSVHDFFTLDNGLSALIFSAGNQMLLATFGTNSKLIDVWGYSPVQAEKPVRRENLLSQKNRFEEAIYKPDHPEQDDLGGENG